MRSAGGQAYARPSSLQSNQSPAAYLRYLYRIAMGLNQEIGITPPERGARRLEMRRPDLARLVLSETSLKQEIATIELVDEVLATGLGEIDIRTTFYPIALPFDEPASATRAALGPDLPLILRLSQWKQQPSIRPANPPFSPSPLHHSDNLISFMPTI